MANNNVTEAIRMIRSVSYALEGLEVKGRQNMDILLGSMQALDRAANIIDHAMQEMTRPAPQPQPEVKLEVVPKPDEEPAEGESPTE